MRYINWETDKFFQAHHLWNSVDHNHTDVHRASIKCRLVTCTYILQANKARFNKFAVNPTCLLCREHPENRMHFLLEYTALASSRTKYINDYKSLIAENFNEDLWEEISSDNNSFLQLILDCTKCPQASALQNINIVHELEALSRRLCYALHQHRSKFISDACVPENPP